MNAKEREVLQLLRDYQPWKAAYGGTPPMDESAGVSEANYGPAGLILEGAEFEERDRKRLAESMRHLEDALQWLMREDFPLWYVLLEPYLREPGDPSLVQHWRTWADRLDTAAAKASLHDKAIRELAGYLKGVDLFPVFPKLLSAEEERKMENKHREMVAYFHRLKRGGQSERAAKAQVADTYRVEVDTIERLLDVREAIGPGPCEEEDCENTARAGGLCTKHYQQQRRFKKRRRAS